MTSDEILKEARLLRQLIEAAAQKLDDKDAVNFTQLYPKWSPDHGKYKAGERVEKSGVLYKCLQDHIAQETWSPLVAPSLWSEVLAQDGTISEWKQPNSTNGYSKGDKVIFNGKTYQSIIDNNVWSPSAYPTGWKEV